MKKFLASTLALIAGLALCLPVLATPTALTPVNPPTILGSPGAGTLQLTWTAADVANGNSVPLTGSEVVLIWNTHASTGYTCSVSTVADRLGRTNDLTSYALAAGDIAMYGPVPTEGYQQTNGNLNLSANNASV